MNLSASASSFAPTLASGGGGKGDGSGGGGEVGVEQGVGKGLSAAASSFTPGGAGGGFNPAASAFTPSAAASSFTPSAAASSFTPAAPAAAAFNPAAAEFAPMGVSEPVLPGAALGMQHLATSAQGRAATTCVAFDPLQELVWTGSATGVLTSLHSLTLTPRVSVPTKPRAGLHSVFPSVHGVTSCSPSAVFFHSRGGVLRQTHTPPEGVTVLSACAPTVSSPTFLLGTNSSVQLYDLRRNRITQTIPVSHSVTAVARGQSSLFVTGTEVGMLELRDGRSRNASLLSQCMTHPGGVAALDVKGNLVLSTGYSGRHYMPDQLVHIFDLRMMQPLTPVSVPGGASLARFLPSLTSSFVAASPAGQLHIFDAAAAGPPSAYDQVLSSAALTCAAFSSSGAHLAFANAVGEVVQWATHPEAPLNADSQPVEAVHARAPDDLPYVDEFGPFSQIPMAYVPRNMLVSTWPPDMLKQLRPLPPLDPGLVHGVKYSGTIGYAPAPDSADFVPNSRRSFKQFTTSRKATDKARRNKNMMVSPAVGERNQVRREYAKVKIKVNNLILSRFNFGKYNRSNFTGLVNLLPNSYCNAAIQLLYFVPQLRTALSNHLCDLESCLSCELGLLFHMMDQSRGRTAEPRNFLRVLRQIPEADALGLLDQTLENPELVLAHRIQDFDRFLLQHLHKELTDRSAATDSSDTTISDLFGYHTSKSLSCLSGKHTTSRDSRVFTTKFSYPVTRQYVSFAQLVTRSLCDEVSLRIWCDGCKGYQPSKQLKKPLSLPPLLDLHCNVTTDGELDLWRGALTPRDEAKLPYVPPFLHISIDGATGQPVARRLEYLPESFSTSSASRRLSFDEDEADAGGAEEEVEDGAMYRLVGLIAHITDPPDSDSVLNTINGEHLVTHVWVPPSEGPMPDSVDRWLLCNDFVINNSSYEEAVNFSYPWKQPCVVWYARVDLDDTVRVEPTEEHLALIRNAVYGVPSIDDAVARQRPPQVPLHEPTFQPLAAHEELGPGSLVAIDCEFVAVELEESVQRSDGRRVIIKPSRLTLARVSVLRESGTPFIDDYILTSERVVDFLTQWSGIEPGDLDPAISPHHLTTLKGAYLKLRSLVDRGVIFVGHGLSKDFQMLNIVVPKKQILDTVELFHKKGSRRLGLRFLSKMLLQTSIQEGNHDSIEDALAALRLVQLHRKLEAEGKVEETVKGLYEAGHRFGFKV